MGAWRSGEVKLFRWRKVGSGKKIHKKKRGRRAQVEQRNRHCSLLSSLQCHFRGTFFCQRKKLFPPPPRPSAKGESTRQLEGKGADRTSEDEGCRLLGRRDSQPTTNTTKYNALLFLGLGSMVLVIKGAYKVPRKYLSQRPSQQ